MAETYESLRKQAEELRRKIKQIDNQVFKAGGPNDRAQKLNQERVALAKQLGEAGLDPSKQQKLKTDLETVKKEYDKAIKEIQTMNAERYDLEVEAKKLEAKAGRLPKAEPGRSSYLETAADAIVRAIKLSKGSASNIDSQTELAIKRTNEVRSVRASEPIRNISSDLDKAIQNIRAASTAAALIDAIKEDPEKASDYDSAVSRFENAIIASISLLNSAKTKAKF